ncbi:MAG: hypothetical protein MK289_18955 [Trichodesmium sp. ALOHA_ZT_67]|nr:hypothetical protein [Trichodesmium sp. ALOHA_ZT_67]
MKYDLKLIRDLINKALGPEEFADLVFYNFRDVYSQFTNGQSKRQRILILLDYIDKHEKIDDLLNEIQEINPKAFNEFETGRQEQTNLSGSRNKEYKAINDLGEYLQNQSFEKLEKIYLSCRPEMADKTVKNIDDILTQLNRIVPPKKYRLIIPFVVGIQQQVSDSNLQKTLDKWLEEYGNFFGYSEFKETATPNFRQSSPDTQNPKLLESYLLIELKKKNYSSLQIQSWFWSSQLIRNIQEKDLIEREYLSKKLTELIDESNKRMKKIGSKDLRIELFLDTNLLIESNSYFDWLEVTKLNRPAKMCKQYIVTFRLAERLKDTAQDLGGAWQRKWENLNSNQGNVVDFYHTDDYELGLNKTVGIKLNKLSELTKFFDLIVLNSLPLAIWSRRDLQTISCQNEINRILRNVEGNFNQLPKEVTDERKKAKGEEHIGKHICLLWDNPERMPPEPSEPKYALSS